MLAQKRHNLTVRNPLVVKRIHILQQLFHFLLLFQNAHADDKSSEFLLVDHAIWVCVELFERPVKFG